MQSKALDIRIVDGVLYWENHVDVMSVKEAKSISDEIRELVDRTPLKGMVVDTRKISGRWSPEVDRIWIDLMAYLPSRELKAATVCQDVINKLQFNYLSSQAGTTDSVKAFVTEEKEALCSFLNIENINL